jgi:hypothetical protein
MGYLCLHCISLSFRCCGGSFCGSGSVSSVLLLKLELLEEGSHSFCMMKVALLQLLLVLLLLLLQLLHCERYIMKTLPLTRVPASITKSSLARNTATFSPCGLHVLHVLCSSDCGYGSSCFQL